VRDWITPQLIRHDLPWLGTMTADHAFENSLRSSAIAPGMQKYINDFNVLVRGPPLATRQQVA